MSDKERTAARRRAIHASHNGVLIVTPDTMIPSRINLLHDEKYGCRPENDLARAVLPHFDPVKDNAYDHHNEHVEHKIESCRNANCRAARNKFVDEPPERLPADV